MVTSTAVRCFSALLCLGLLSIPCYAQNDARRLAVGDPAPALSVRSWLNGSPVGAFESGAVYVVEFWATWCGPCRSVMPHMSELNTTFADQGVVFVGVSVDDGDASSVTSFVEEMGSGVNYRVAIDEPGTEPGASGKTEAAWMDAAGRQGIPCAFVVDGDGRVAWVGHPLDGLDRVLPLVLAGHFDARAYAVLTARKATLREGIVDAFDLGNWKKVMRGTEAMMSLDPETAPDMGPLQVAALIRTGRHNADACRTALALAKGRCANSGPALNSIAWSLLCASGAGKRERAAALRIAEQAATLTGREDADVLDTLARALFDSGRVHEAVATQRSAVEKAGDDRGDYTDRLGRYVQRQAALTRETR